MQDVLHAFLLRQIAKFFRGADCATLLPPRWASQEIPAAHLRNDSKRKRTRNSAADTSDSPLMKGDAVFSRLDALEIETPSWAYGNSGTRFHVYPWPGAARTVWERIDDAALVHELTASCPSVALNIPWDTVDDWST